MMLLPGLLSRWNYRYAPSYLVLRNDPFKPCTLRHLLGSGSQVQIQLPNTGQLPDFEAAPSQNLSDCICNAGTTITDPLGYCDGSEVTHTRRGDLHVCDCHDLGKHWESFFPYTKLQGEN
jgi:hypothetical protein